MNNYERTCASYITYLPSVPIRTYLNNHTEDSEPCYGSKNAKDPMDEAHLSNPCYHLLPFEPVG
jgi:hypothetical protein